MTAEAPERIWLDVDEPAENWTNDPTDAKHDEAEYVRADTLAALTAERDALREKQSETLTALRMAYLALKTFSDSDSERKRFVEMISEVDDERAALDATKDQRG